MSEKQISTIKGFVYDSYHTAKWQTQTTQQKFKVDINLQCQISNKKKSSHLKVHGDAINHQSKIHSKIKLT